MIGTCPPIFPDFPFNSPTFRRIFSTQGLSMMQELF